MRSLFWPLVRSGMTLAAAVAGVAALSPSPSAAPMRLSSRYWLVASDAWKTPGPETFPETEALKGRPDFGIAFSGGGTRSAAATIGQLRGLHRKGWLRRVKYMTAVSGGSWAAVPFVFADRPIDDLLGPSLAAKDLSKTTLEREPPAGSLPLAVVRSKLGAHSAVEAAEFVARRRAAREETPAALKALIDRVVKSGSDRTFADLLRRVFLDPVLTKEEAGLRYTWDAASLDGLLKENATLGYKDFLRAAPDRPFPVIGGTIIATHPAMAYRA